MDIIEKLMTGNFGFGSIILIVGIMVGLYYTVIEPRVKQLERDKKEDNDTIKSLKDQIADKDSLVEENLAVITSQQIAIKEQAESLKKQERIAEQFAKIETLEQLVLQCDNKMGEVIATVKDGAREVANELNKDSHTLNGLKEQLEKLSDTTASNYNTINQSIQKIESSLKQVADAKYTDQSDMVARLSGIMADISDLKTLIAVHRSSTLTNRQSSSFEDSMMQEVK